MSRNLIACIGDLPEYRCIVLALIADDEKGGMGIVIVKDVEYLT